MRIAAFTDPSNGSTSYRALEPISELGRRGHRAYISSLEDRRDEIILDFEVAYIQRYQGRHTEETLRELRELGLAIVWDHDDNVADTPQQKTGALNWQQTLAEIRTMIQLSDVVTTTNEVLAAGYRKLVDGACVHVVENYLPSRFVGVKPRPHEGLVIGWIAWGDHQRDWNALGLRHTVTALLQRHPDVRVESVGPIDLGLPKPQYTRTGPVNFVELADKIAGFDIGIAPLADIPFNHSRSSIKLKEYANLGVPWLASPIGPYAGLGEKQGGRLVPDDGWAPALEEIVSNARLRRKLSKRGSKWAAGETLAKNIGKWEAALQEALKRGRARREAATAAR
jgi:glycosyltransferase involved in cell wall biosynthesis